MVRQVGYFELDDPYFSLENLLYTAGNLLTHMFGSGTAKEMLEGTRSYARIMRPKNGKPYYTMHVHMTPGQADRFDRGW